jgi:hypothetical protein
MNNSAILQNALGNLSHASINSIGIPNGSVSTVFNTNNSYKTPPTFKMELFKSENGGFIMNLITWDANTYTEKTKLFILNEVENMGRDIQNILVMEILKS